MSNTMKDITFIPKAVVYRIGSMIDMEELRDKINVGDIIMQRCFPTVTGYDFVYEVVAKDVNSVTLHHLISEDEEATGNHAEDYVYTFLGRGERKKVTEY